MVSVNLRCFSLEAATIWLTVSLTAAALTLLFYFKLYIDVSYMDAIHYLNEWVYIVFLFDGWMDGWMDGWILAYLMAKNRKGKIQGSVSRGTI